MLIANQLSLYHAALSLCLGAMQGKDGCYYTIGSVELF